MKTHFTRSTLDEITCEAFTEAQASSGKQSELLMAICEAASNLHAFIRHNEATHESTLRHIREMGAPRTLAIDSK